MNSSPFLSQTVTGISLAMDCTAVTIAYGLSKKAKPDLGQFKMGIAFGVSQAMMFVIGWLFGNGFRVYLARWDHWIAFLLLFGIGTKMIFETFQKEKGPQFWNTKWSAVLVLALATSVDALAVGLGFSLTGSGLLMPSMLIGFFSFVLPLVGYYGAAQLSGSLSHWAERAGGSVLITLGVKILYTHLKNGI